MHVNAMNFLFAAMPHAVCGKCDMYSVYTKKKKGILLIQLYWSKSREPRSDSNIILCESEKKLIQLIHDKQFHLIMIGHPRARFSFMRISLISCLLDPNKERERSWSKTSLAISSQKNIIPSHYHELREFGCLTHGRYVNGNWQGWRNHFEMVWAYTVNKVSITKLIFARLK